MVSFDKLIEEEQYQTLVVINDQRAYNWMANVVKDEKSPFLIEKSVIEGLISILPDWDLRRGLETMISTVDWENDKIFYFFD